jgi:threonine dehydrogenase-like Zn-dependent dehydrogenase
MMQAAVLTGPQRFTLHTTEVPAPGPGQVRIKLEGSGVSASSIPLWQGREWVDYPQAEGMPGHEGWGHIEALGENVSGLAVGDRVAVVSQRAFAEYDITTADAVVPLPAELDDVPFPSEPFGCAFNLFARADIRSTHTVAIIGIGFLGAVLTRLASSAGARVIALSRRTYALTMARQMGALDRVSLRKGEPLAVVARVRDLTDGKLCERVIDCVGAPEAWDLADQLTAADGRLISVADTREQDRLPYVEGIRAAAHALASGVLNPLPLITHRYPLAKLDDAFRVASERPEGFLKAVVFA